MSYKVRIDSFEGPFDLLLYLVSRQKVDIGAISITEIADQYLAEVSRMGELDLDVASDFLLVASTLLQIKAESLIPRDRADVDEEIAELKEAYALAAKSADGRVLKDADAAGDADAAALAEAVELEFGDVLFSLVNVARRMGVDSERALRGACAKFRRRWAFMEGAAWSAGERIEDASADRLEELWQAAKAQEVSRG